jgi:hypothetical protein
MITQAGVDCRGFGVRRMECGPPTGGLPLFSTLVAPTPRWRGRRSLHENCGTEGRRCRRNSSTLATQKQPCKAGPHPKALRRQPCQIRAVCANQRTYSSVQGVLGNRHPYCDRWAPWNSCIRTRLEGDWWSRPRIGSGQATTISPWICPALRPATYRTLCGRPDSDILRAAAGAVSDMGEGHGRRSADRDGYALAKGGVT